MHAAGWSVYAPLLPGHGRSLRAFAASGADEWIGAARATLRDVLKRLGKFFNQLGAELSQPFCDLTYGLQRLQATRLRAALHSEQGHYAVPGKLIRCSTGNSMA